MLAYPILVTALTCYLLGNLNGSVFASLLHNDDVRRHGSGNAGLTNFIRNYGAKSSLMVIAVDGGKAILACLTARLIFAPYGYALEGTVLGGLCVMLGHDFPALLGFKGGKGILSGVFVALLIDWRIALLILAVFLAAYLLTQYVSLGSVLAAFAFGVGFVIFHHDNPLVLTGGLIMSLLTLYMHRGNISRLLKGQERKTNLLGKGKRQQ